MWHPGSGVVLVCVVLIFVAFLTFMLSLSDNNQANAVEAFNSKSRYVDDLLNIDKPHIE